MPTDLVTRNTNRAKSIFAARNALYDYGKEYSIDEATGAKVVPNEAYETAARQYEEAAARWSAFKQKQKEQAKILGDADRLLSKEQDHLVSIMIITSDTKFPRLHWLRAAYKMVQLKEYRVAKAKVKAYRLALEADMEAERRAILEDFEAKRKEMARAAAEDDPNATRSQEMLLAMMKGWADAPSGTAKSKY